MATATKIGETLLVESTTVSHCTQVGRTACKALVGPPVLLPGLTANLRWFPGDFAGWFNVTRVSTRCMCWQVTCSTKSRTEVQSLELVARSVSDPKETFESRLFSRDFWIETCWLVHSHNRTKPRIRSDRTSLRTARSQKELIRLRFSDVRSLSTVAFSVMDFGSAVDRNLWVGAILEETVAGGGGRRLIGFSGAAAPTFASSARFAPISGFCLFVCAAIRRNWGVLGGGTSPLREIVVGFSSR